MDKAAHDLLFDIRRSVRYHDRREGFFSRIRNAADLFAFVGMSAAVAEIATGVGSGWPLLLQLAGPLLAAVLVGVALVYQVSAKSTLHNRLKREFIALEQSMLRHGDSVPPEVLADLTHRRLEIEADEPPILRVLDTICYNDVVWAMGLDPKNQMRPVTPIQRMLAAFIDVQRDRLYQENGTPATPD